MIYKNNQRMNVVIKGVRTLFLAFSRPVLVLPTRLASPNLGPSQPPQPYRLLSSRSPFPPACRAEAGERRRVKNAPLPPQIKILVYFVTLCKNLPPGEARVCANALHVAFLDWRSANLPISED
jgi:hypothetical protein